MCEINVRIIIGSPLADDDKKGDALFREIQNAASLHGDEGILLDFEDVDLVNTAFLNNAIGRLYNAEEFDLNKVHIKVVNMKENMLDLLKESVKTARLMYG